MATGCNIAGIAYYVHCNYTLTAVTQPSAGVTTGSTDETCALKQVAGDFTICTLHGAVHGTYTNPAGATPGRITAFTSASLRLTNAAAGTCPLGNGDIAVLSHKTGTISSANSPSITRTA